MISLNYRREMQQLDLEAIVVRRMDKMIIVCTMFLCLLFNMCAVYAQTVPIGFEVIDINTSLDDDAVGFALLPDGRVLLIHQFSGKVKLLVNGVLKAETLLTVPNVAGLVEKGLLGIAVDPEFPERPYVYLFHTFDGDPDNNHVSRFTLTGDLTDSDSDNLAIDPASQLVLIDDMPAESNSHNGGTLRFAPDKTLLVSHGDDRNRSKVQNLTSLKGKILRINRDGTIPADNPAFPSEPANKRPEVFAFGLRNPFRFAVDPATGRLFIGDVGNKEREEIDISVGGENFGWPRFEGTLDFDTGADLIPPTPTDPVWEYHLAGANSVVALVAYRQQDFGNDFSFPDEYEGTLFYADFYDDVIHNLRQEESGLWTSSEFASGFGNNPVDGALGKDGSIYILEYGTALRKINYINQAVPVELHSFHAQVVDASIVLTWQTATETNNYGFEVQRGQTQRNFHRIAFVAGRGDSVRPQFYQYKDPQPGVGVFFYRLRQIDLNGDSDYSPIVSVNVPAPEDFVLLQNYPNPFNGSTRIEFTVLANRSGGTQVQRVRLSVFDIRGRLVRVLVDDVKTSGRYWVDWDGKDHNGSITASGVFLVTLKAESLSGTRKIIHVR